MVTIEGSMYLGLEIPPDTLTPSEGLGSPLARAQGLGLDGPLPSPALELDVEFLASLLFPNYAKVCHGAGTSTIQRFGSARLFSALCNYAP